MNKNIILNQIFINDEQLLYTYYNDNDKKIYIVGSDKNQYIRSTVKSLKIQCSDCKVFSIKKIFQKVFLTKSFLCHSCCIKGERNGFYGKKHSQETKEKWSIQASEAYKGSGNPFYGKKHSQETKKKLSLINAEIHKGENNHFYGKTHTKETKEQISINNKLFYNSLSEEKKQECNQKLLIGGLKFKKENPEQYIKNKQYAARCSIISQFKNKNMNKPETKVFEEIKNLGFVFSVILGKYQYDFGLKKQRILVEVHGDYWHGNPNIYKFEDLNEIQLKKKKRDEEKLNFALKHGFKIFYIWEEEITNNNYSIIEEIKNEINKNK